VSAYVYSGVSYIAALVGIPVLRGRIAECKVDVMV
jgi:hypothetical protein